MSDTHLRRKDTTKGPPLRILSLDGGGVRGYSMLIIIQELMHRTYVETEGKAPRRDQIPKPCDHFDLIVGTGTGGLIAIMLGRLRLDLEQCKELYVRLTRMVFQYDKTIAGIPYRSTLFKASMLESAIKEAVREHTISSEEGNDGVPTDPISAAKFSSAAAGPRRHQSNASVVSFSARSPTSQINRPAFRGAGGDPNARLYDERENRTKTAITAMYRGGHRSSDAALLRSYDSRKEPAPEYDCRIWEAGRATCAIGMAFKEIRIGQSVFHDDGAGHFNPAPVALDEATVNEWPGRDVGVFISIGTGRRPRGTDDAQHQWYENFMGEFAEGKKRLIAKIEQCETVHERMKKELLLRRGVNIENYYRFNVEVGVGEFGMNEWHRLGEISSGTRRYMGRDAEQKMVQGSCTKLAKIYRAKLRYESSGGAAGETVLSPAHAGPPANYINAPLAVELPGDMPPMPLPRAKNDTSPSRQSYDSGVDHISLPGSGPPPTSVGSSPPRPPTSHASPPLAAARPARKPESPTPLANATKPPPEDDEDRLVVSAPTPSQYRTAAGTDKIAIMAADEYSRRPANDPTNKPLPRPGPQQRVEGPPLPPKTPLPENQAAAGRRPQPPPYPMDDDGPPPAVNMARKPDFRNR